MPARALPGVQRALGRFTGGPSAADAVRVAGELVGAGCDVALEHQPPGATGAMTVLAAKLTGAGLSPRCQVTVAVDVLGRAAETLAVRLLESGVGVALAGAAGPVDALARRLPEACVVVPAAEPGAEERCRLLAAGPVRLVAGRRTDAELAFVRCLNVLMVGSGRPAVATTDRRLIAIAGERAAWYDRSADSWEHVMPLGVRSDEQRRLVAAGYRVRVGVPWGPEAPAAVLRQLVRRVSPERAAELTARYGVPAVDLAEAAERARVLLLAVKPQDIGTLLGSLAGSVDPGRHLIVSVAAGIPTRRIEAALPSGTPVVRVMPNTPALVDEGMSVLSPGAHAGESHLDQAEALLSAVGRVRRVPESQQDAVTALSGSGPAYFFFLVEAMIDAGILLGLPRALAADLIVQTALGAAVMLRDSGEHPVQLREAVTSPGGTTIAAIRELERHGVRAALIAAIEAAHARSVELGGS